MSCVLSIQNLAIQNTKIVSDFVDISMLLHILVFWAYIYGLNICLLIILDSAETQNFSLLLLSPFLSKHRIILVPLLWKAKLSKVHFCGVVHPKNVYKD